MKQKSIQTIYQNEQTCFIALPLEYVYHDELINPRGINSSISKLVKEFEKKNPQLHLSLGRIEEKQNQNFWWTT